METEVRWNDRNHSELEKQLIAASYGQIYIGDLVYEANVSDPRFEAEDALPWDAYAEITEEGLLKLIGMTGPSGQEPGKEVVLPDDVLIRLDVWERKLVPR